MDNERKTFKILTYNVFVRPPGIKNNKDDYKDERLKLFVEDELAKWDIVALQEMFGAFSSRQKNLIAAAKKKGLPYHVKSPAPSLFSGYLVDGGLMILSRFPIVKEAHMTFSKKISSDSLAAKGVIYAKIEVECGIFVHVFNTHLQASYNDPKSVQNQQARAEEVRSTQLQEMRDFVHKQTCEDGNNPHPIVLLGDFNVNGRTGAFDSTDSPEYQAMCKELAGTQFALADILKDQLGCHPPTVGDYHEVNGEILAREVCLTNPVDQKLAKRLDYIFWLSRTYEQNNHHHHHIGSNHNNNNNGKALKTAVPSKCEVVHFFVDPIQRSFSQLSDHYGISLTVEYDKDIDSDFVFVPSHNNNKN